MEDLLRQLQSGEIDTVKKLHITLSIVATSILGKITQIGLEDKRFNKIIKAKKVDFDAWIKRQEHKNKYIQLSNAIITPSGDIIVTNTKDLKLIKLDIFDREACDIKIIEIIHDNHEGFNIKFVESVLIETLTPETDIQFKRLGLSHYQNKQNTYKLNSRDLVILLSKWAIFNYRMKHRFNIVINKNMVQLVEPNIVGIKYTVNNSQLEKINIWKNKMKMLGLIDEYSISSDDRVLIKYIGKSSKPPIPPVRKIGLSALIDTKIEELIIPDTVEVLGAEFTQLNHTSIKCIDISKAKHLRNIASIDYILYSHKDKEINADNILFSNIKFDKVKYEIANIQGIRISPVQFIDCKPETWQGINTLTLVNYREKTKNEI